MPSSHSRSTLGASGTLLGTRVHGSSIYLVALLAVVLGACSDLTRVDAPDLVQPAALNDSAGALARRAGAIARFASALATQTTQTGVFTDEFLDANGVFPADRRTVTVDNSTYPFTELSRARIDALRAILTLQRYAPSRRADVGELYALAGFTETIMAEDLCSPLPLAVVTDGMPIETVTYAGADLLDHALAMFDSASHYAADADSIRYLIELGRARTLLALNDVDGAAAAVADVPIAYAYRLPFTATISTQTNTVYRDIVVRRNLSVADREGGNGLAFVSGQDPRVVTQVVGQSSKGIPVYNFAADASLGAPITLASGVEGLLVQAEAALRHDQPAAWSSALNEARQEAISPPLPPLPADSTSDASAAERVDVLFHERAFWLFGTGRRLGDLRRLIRQYGRAPESVFPTGQYQQQSISYGSDVTFVMRGEEPNPTFSGCEDRTP